jgi:hypothetical protein
MHKAHLVLKGKTGTMNRAPLEISGGDGPESPYQWSIYPDLRTASRVGTKLARVM